jgi:hypothetical protein
MNTNQQMMQKTTMKGNTHKPFHTDNYVNDDRAAARHQSTAQSSHVDVFEYEPIGFMSRGRW